MALVDDIRTYVATQTGGDPNTDTLVHKVIGVGIYCASPTHTWVKTPDGFLWCSLWSFVDSVWIENVSCHKDVGDTYVYNDKNEVVPNYVAEVS